MVNYDPDKLAQDFEEWMEATKDVREKQRKVTIPDVLDLLDMDQAPDWHVGDWDPKHHHTGFVNEEDRDMTIRLTVDELVVELYDKVEEEHWEITAPIQKDGKVDRDALEQEPSSPSPHQPVVVFDN